LSKAAVCVLRRLKLLDRKYRPVNLNDWTDEQSTGALREYYSARIASADAEAKEHAAQSASFATLVSSQSAAIEASHLLPGFFVFGAIYIPDPVFRMAVPESSSTRASRQALGGTRGRLVDRESLRAKLQLLGSLAGFFRDGLSAALPLALLHEQGEEVPIFYSADNYRSTLSPEIYRYVHGYAEVRRVVVNEADGSICVQPQLATEPSRAISISFSNDPINAGMFFFYTDANWVKAGDEPGSFRVRYRYELDKAIDDEIYSIWREQTINRTAINRLRRVGSEIAFAENLGATYLTESPFESGLLGLAGNVQEEASAACAVNLLRANLPILTAENAAEVLKIRRRSRRVFEKLQMALLDAALELQGVDEAAFDVQAGRVFRRLIEPELRNAERKLQKTVLRGVSSLGAIGANAALAVLSGSSLPLGAIIGLASAGTAVTALPSIASYIESRRRPEHILWSLSRSR